MTALARLARNAISISLPAIFVAVSVPAAEPPQGATTVREAAVIALDFPGGSWAEFAIALEKASGRRANLIMPQDVTVPVPAIRVSGAGLPQIFQAIRLVERRLSIERVMGDQADDPVYAVMLAPAHRESQVARSYSVELLLEKYTINDVTTAVKTAWDMARAGNADRSGMTPKGAAWTAAGPEPELKFHQETTLLLVRGSGREVELAENVLGQLSKALRPTPGSNRTPEELAALRASLLDLEADRAGIEAELALIQKSSGEHPQIDFVKARLRAVEARIKNIKTAIGE